MTRFLILSLLVFMSVFTACRKPLTATSGQNDQLQLPADFDKFYEKFHSDSLYQLAHIQFPLDGLPLNVDSLTQANDDYSWSAENWIMHHDPIGEDPNIMRTFSFSPLGDNIIIEQVVDKSNGFGTERRFYKQGDEWILIYYSDMNRKQ